MSSADTRPRRRRPLPTRRRWWSSGNCNSRRNQRQEAADNINQQEGQQHAENHHVSWPLHPQHQQHHGISQSRIKWNARFRAAHQRNHHKHNTIFSRWYRCSKEGEYGTQLYTVLVRVTQSREPNLVINPGSSRPCDRYENFKCPGPLLEHDYPNETLSVDSVLFRVRSRSAFSRVQEWGPSCFGR